MKTIDETEVSQPPASVMQGTFFGDRLWLGLVLLLGAIGVFLRIYPSAMFTGVGFDEHLYWHYVDQLSAVGLFDYPAIVEAYLKQQRELTFSILPPLRFLYIFTAYIWRSLFGTSSLTALHQVSCCFSILTLPVAFGFSWRLAGKWAAAGVLALMCFAPTQIHMSQHALVDGFFAFWALLTVWLLWENLQRPNHPGLLLAFSAGLMLMVLTKENAFFVFVAVCAIITANRWLSFGTVTPRLLVYTVAGPALGVICLTMLAGGVPEIIETYQQSVSKNFTLPYAIKTGDGPWYRYIVDLMLMSPVVLLLAIGGIFHLNRLKKGLVFLTIFIGASYLVMCNLKYAMNMRYTNMWDMPLRLLAFTQLSALCSGFGLRKHYILSLAVFAVCAVELRQYKVFFVDVPLYEMVSEGLLRAVKILK